MVGDVGIKPSKELVLVEPLTVVPCISDGTGLLLPAAHVVRIGL